MGKSKFQSSWQDTQPWVKKCSTCLHHENCIFCGTTINISAGVIQLQLHEKANKISKMKRQQTSSPDLEQWMEN